MLSMIVRRRSEGKNRIEMMHLTAFSIHEERGIALEPSQNVQGCLERIWQVFRLRARLFLFQDGALLSFQAPVVLLTRLYEPVKARLEDLVKRLGRQ